MIKLSKREKVLLQILAVVVIVVAAYFFVVKPVVDFQNTSASEMSTNKSKLEQLDSIYREYRSLQEKNSNYRTLLASKKDNITSLVQELSVSNNISRNIANNTSSQTNIQNKYVRVKTDIKVEGAPIQNLVKFIYEIENSSPLVKVSSLKITKAFKESNTYDASIKVDNYSNK